MVKHAIDLWHPESRGDVSIFIAADTRGRLAVPDDRASRSDKRASSLPPSPSPPGRPRRRVSPAVGLLKAVLCAGSVVLGLFFNR